MKRFFFEARLWVSLILKGILLIMSMIFMALISVLFMVFIAIGWVLGMKVTIKIDGEKRYYRWFKRIA